MKTLEDFANDDPMEPKPPYPYEGPEALRQPILDALTKVVDPEVAMSIVDVGLIYGVEVTAEKVHVLITMTSAACPVTDLIVEEVETELDRIAPPELLVHVELAWDPPWTMERMSQRARRFMGW
jgi:metal-sulfur cluster biosynthetic enzyme